MSAEMRERVLIHKSQSFRKKSRRLIGYFWLNDISKFGSGLIFNCLMETQKVKQTKAFIF